MNAINLSPLSGQAGNRHVTRVLGAVAVVALAWAASVAGSNAHARGDAQAKDLYFSVGVTSPGMSIGVGNLPPPPVIYAPPPPVYYRPPQVTYVPAPVVVQRPPVVVYEPYPEWRPPRRGLDNHRHHHHHHDNRRWDDDDDGYRDGPRGGRGGRY